MSWDNAINFLQNGRVLSKLRVKFFKIFLMIIGSAMVVGCGSIKPPIEKVAVAEQMLNQAETAEVKQYAPLEVQMARDKFEQAKRAMDAENYTVAERLADQAALDARTAMAKADSIKAQHAVDELKQSIELLRQQLKIR